MSDLALQQTSPHISFIEYLKKDPNSEKNNVQDPEKNKQSSNTDLSKIGMDGGGRARFKEQEKVKEIKPVNIKDIYVGGLDGAGPARFREQQKLKDKTVEIGGTLFPPDPIKTAKNILNESNPRAQLTLLMGFQNELDKMNSSELNQLKGYLEAKKEELSPDNINKGPFSKSELIDSLLNTVNREILTRNINLREFEPVIINPVKFKVD